MTTKNILDSVNAIVPGFIEKWEYGPKKICGQDEYNSIIDVFTTSWEKGPQQRSPEWYQLVGRTIGGSEISAIMNEDKYRGVEEVIVGKLNALTDSNAVEIDNLRSALACQWGILFEDVIKMSVEYDLKTEVKGDQICVQIMEGYRTSPDGYCVIHVNCDGSLDTLKGDGHAVRDPNENTNHRRTKLQGQTKVPLIALIEFKCPYIRVPKGNIPDNYCSQVLSGLAVSPIAHIGLFVDAMFKICGLKDIGFNRVYNRTIHKFPNVWKTPISWGLIGVYAPTIFAPENVRNAKFLDYPNAINVIKLVSEMYANYVTMTTPVDAVMEDIDIVTIDIIDFGSTNAAMIERMFDMINRKVFKVHRIDPMFTGKVDEMDLIYGLKERVKTEHSLEHYALIGVVPWKLMDLQYAYAERDNDFVAKVLPHINGVHQKVKDIMDGKDTKPILKKIPAGKVSSPTRGSPKKDPTFAYQGDCRKNVSNIIQQNIPEHIPVYSSSSSSTSSAALDLPNGALTMSL